MAEKLVIKIDGDIKNYRNALKKAQSQTESLASSLSSIAKSAGIAFAGLSATIFGAVSAWREQEQAQIRTEQTLKATGFAAGLTSKQIFSMASELQKVTTFGDEAIISGQNLLLTFRNIGEKTFPRATEIMLDMSTAMNQDLKSSAIQLGKALNDPITGITALSRVGITFTEDQKAMIKAMQDSGDIAGAQAIILAELENQFGGVSRAAAGGTGAFLQLKNSAGDFVEVIGKNLAPVLVQVAKSAKGFVDTLIANQEIAKTASVIIGVGAAITGLVAGLGLAAGAFLKLRAVMIATMPIIKGLNLSVKGLVGATGIGLLLIVITDLAVNWETRLIQMQSIFKGFSDNIGNMSAALKKIMMGIISFDKDQIAQGLSEIKNAFVTTFDDISNESEKRLADLKKQQDQELSILRKTASETEEIEKGKIEAKKQADEQLAAANQAQNEKRRQALKEEIQAIQELRPLETEQELAQLQQRIDAKAQQDELAKIMELERQGKFDEAQIEAERIKNERLVELTKRRLAQKAALQQQEQQINQANLAATQNFIQAGATLAQQGSQEAKALQSVNALISTYTAANQALSSPPGPPFTIPLAASVVALGLANVQRIQSAKFREGGVFTGGLAGVDSIPATVQRNEIVAPTKSFDEVVEGVARQRGAIFPEDRQATNNQSTVTVVLEPKGDFINFIEQKIVEARTQNTGIL